MMAERLNNYEMQINSGVIHICGICVHRLMDVAVNSDWNWRIPCSRALR